MPPCDEFVTFCQNFDFKIRRDHQKNLLWAVQLWVGRRKELTLDYVPKKDKKKNRIQAVKGWWKWKFTHLFKPFMPLCDEFVTYYQKFDFKIRRDHQKNFLWASRLWVGRRKEPISDYVPKNDKKNQAVKG